MHRGVTGPQRYHGETSADFSLSHPRSRGNKESLAEACRRPGPTTTDATDLQESRRSRPALFEAFCGVGFLTVRLIAPARRSASGVIVVRGLPLSSRILAGDCRVGRYSA